MNKSTQLTSTQYSTEGIGKFLGIAFGWSWLLWGTVIVVPQLSEKIEQILIILGIYGPFIAAIVSIKTGKNEEPVKSFFKRFVQLRAPISSYFIAVLLVPLLFIFSWLICGSYLKISPIIDSTALAILPMVIFLFIANTLPEESSWRGYLMDKFQAKFGPLKTVVIFGFIWGAWHAPLFFIPDFIQNVYVSRIPAFWGVFFLNTMGSSFIYLYLYNRSNRSIFMPTLFHTLFNLMTTLLFITLGFEQTAFYNVSLETANNLTNIQVCFAILVALAGVVIMGVTNGKLGIEHNSFFMKDAQEKESKTA